MTGMGHKVMAAWDIQSFMTQLPRTEERAAAQGPLTWDNEDFIREQKKLTKHYNHEEIFVRKDGFAVWQPKPGENYVIMPPKYAPKLAKWQHERMCHAGQAKVHTALAKHFHWPNMRSDVRKWVSACPDCQLLKAKRLRAHQHFRANPQYEPRTSYGMDFYAIPKSKQGYTQLLGIIDLATSELTLCPTKDRSAATVAECLIQRIFLEKGCPISIHSDHAREFISKATKRICRVMGAVPADHYTSAPSNRKREN